MSTQELNSMVAAALVVKNEAVRDIQAVENEAKSLWVDGVRFWYALWSVRMAILSAILGGLTALLPTWQPAMPVFPFAILTTVCAALTGLVSLVKQPALLATIEADRRARAETAAKAEAEVAAEAQAKQDALAQVAHSAAVQAVKEFQAQQQAVATVQTTVTAAPVVQPAPAAAPQAPTV